MQGDKSATDAAERVQSANSFALCRAARRKNLRSRINIVKLCEEFGDRSTRAKRANLANSKIGDNCAIFVRCKATNPQHSKAM